MRFPSSTNNCDVSPSGSEAVRRLFDLLIQTQLLHGGERNRRPRSRTTLSFCNNNVMPSGRE
eukprot:6491117-Amphidinium_carterae.5